MNGRHYYEMWAGPSDPTWFALTYPEQARWEEFGHRINLELELAVALEAPWSE